MKNEFPFNKTDEELSELLYKEILKYGLCKVSENTYVIDNQLHRFPYNGIKTVRGFVFENITILFYESETQINIKAYNTGSSFDATYDDKMNRNYLTAFKKYLKESENVNR